MTGKDGRVPDGTGLSQAEPSGLGPAGFDPSRDEIWAAAVVYSDEGGETWLYLARGLTESAALGQAMADAKTGTFIRGRQTMRVYSPPSDSDGSPKGGDGEAGSVRSTTARAEGIAQGDAP